MPRFTFTTRDLFWIMFLVGFSLWSLKYRHEVRADARTEAKQLAIATAEAKKAQERAFVAEEKANRAAWQLKAALRRLKEEFRIAEEQSRSGGFVGEPPFSTR